MSDLHGLAWHFLYDRGNGPELRDGRPTIAGEWLEHDGAPVLCKAGLHSSARAVDALKYIPGPYVSLCEIDGETVYSMRKLVATRRRPVWIYDATSELQEFARMCALDVVHLWYAPSVVLDYLTTGDESLRAAAWAEAEAVADVAWKAKDATADAAARAARWAADTRNAPRAAACAAACAQAAAATRDVEYVQNDQIEALLIAGAISRGLW